jgi:hypothetical protein
LKIIRGRHEHGYTDSDHQCYEIIILRICK